MFKRTTSLIHLVGLLRKKTVRNEVKDNNNIHS